MKMVDLENYQSLGNFSSATDEIITLRKQIRTQEVEWKKHKAVMEQHIEILELQNREYQEREESLKKMNNSIMTALDDLSKENNSTQFKTLKDLEAALREQQRETNDYRLAAQKNSLKLGKENKELRDKILDLENKLQQSAFKHEKSELALQQQIQLLETEKSSLVTTAKTFEEEKQKYKEKDKKIKELTFKTKELTSQIAKIKEDQIIEIEKIQKECKQTLANTKAISLIEKGAQSHKIQDISKLESELAEIKRILAEETAKFKRERDENNNKIAYYENHVKMQTEVIKSWEEKLLKQKEEKDGEEQEYRKSKQKITDLEIKLKAFEGADQRGKQQLMEKDRLMEELKVDFKKKINAERRRYEQQAEIFKKFKEDAQKKLVVTIQESLKKDETINKLKTQMSQIAKEGRQCRNETSIERKLQQNLTINLSSVENSICNTGAKPLDTNSAVNTC